MGEIAAYILAGGKSSRMGSEKAFLDFEGRSLLELALEKATAITTQVLVVGPKEKFGEHAVEDVYQGQGPLGGIHAALRSSKYELNVILAVDVPRVSVALLRYLVREAEQSTATVIVPRTRDGWQPLCAVYRREFLAPAEKALREGRNRIDALYNQVPVQVVDEEEIARAGFNANIFDNLNTPQDLERARNRKA